MTRHDRNLKTRKPTNLSLDVAVVEEAKTLGINLSRTCEDALHREIAAERGRRWKEENLEAMEAWNVYHENHGSPLDEYRPF